MFSALGLSIVSVCWVKSLRPSCGPLIDVGR